MITHEEFAPLIPHHGRMCLLQVVECWDDKDVRCRTESHRDPDNPLCRDGRLEGVHLIEYGAQAMAIHGALLNRRTGKPPGTGGLLVTARDVKLNVARIDDVAAPLIVRARRLVATGDGWLYAFEVEADGCELARGRVGVLSRSAERPA
jgi:predicted hotdog family 3-hydroxylacyl-ACP dehydratase